MIRASSNQRERGNKIADEETKDKVRNLELKTSDLEQKIKILL